MAEFSVGDRVKILFHKNTEFNDRLGTVTFIGAGLMHGTNPLDYNIEVPGQGRRFIITLDDDTIVDDIESFQLRKL